MECIQFVITIKVGHVIMKHLDNVCLWDIGKKAILNIPSEGRYTKIDTDVHTIMISSQSGKDSKS